MCLSSDKCCKGNDSLVNVIRMHNNLLKWIWKVRCRETMRHSATRPLTTCRAPLPPGKKYVAVRFLNQETIYVVVDARICSAPVLSDFPKYQCLTPPETEVKGKSQDVFDDACKYLGLLDAELFGLAIYQDGEYIFVDRELKLSKYANRSWKSHANGVGNDGQPLLVFHMRVQLYVDCHLLISEKVVRHHYYLQLQENVCNYNQALSEEKVFLLAALALQADLGNYYPEKHKGKYFKLQRYFPAWASEKFGEEYIIRNIPSLHKDNAGLSRGEAQVAYIKEASDLTAPHNLHLYKMQRKKGRFWSSVWLGIRDSGIHIYEEAETGLKALLSSFSWCDIGKLHFEKKKFEIQSEGNSQARRFTYHVHSEEVAKNLLWMCRATHHFHMANQLRVQELKKLELEGGKSYREAYIYTDSADQAREKGQTLTSGRRVKPKAQICDSGISSLGHTKKTSFQFYPLKNRRSEKVSADKRIENSANGIGCGLSLAQYRSMESLPMTNGYPLRSGLKFKSQSIACFAACQALSDNPHLCHQHPWNPLSGESVSTTPTSTLMSRSSCASNTDSACSSLSLTSGSTMKASTYHKKKVNEDASLNDSSQWVKCDSFEEINIAAAEQTNKSMHHKVCISTFVDNRVRTASLYDSSIVESNKTPAQTPKKTSYTSVVYVSVSASPVVSSKPQFSQASVQQPSLVSSTFSLSAPTTTGSGNDTSQPVSSRLSPCNQNTYSINKPSLSFSSQTVSQEKKQYNHANVQKNTFAPVHSRTATRIGVSSLNRDQRFPLTLYDSIKPCGSEPNLSNRKPTSHMDPVSPCPQQPVSALYATRINSRSEMCLSTIGQNPVCKVSKCFSNEHLNKALNSAQQLDLHQSLPDVLGDVSDTVEMDFPCIPPPPAYRNSSDDSCSSGDMNDEVDASASSNLGTVNATSKEKVSGNSCETSHPQAEGHRELCNSLSSPPDVLDLQQLRQKSKDLDLPLISALCNDRSLLMLPKTVPTCSRQRHLAGKDSLRSCYTVPTSSDSKLQSKPSYFPNGGRPVSWHVDSSQIIPSWPKEPKQSPITNWDNKGYSMAALNGSLCPDSQPPLPPTILTSFGKSPEKQLAHSQESSCNSGNHRFSQIQMIPMKLLSGTVGPLPNGRIYQKGSSS